MIIFSRIIFYGILFGACYAIALCVAPIEANLIADGVKWFSVTMAAFSGVTYPVINKAYDLVKIEGMPYRSCLRLQDKVTTLSRSIKARWIIALISSVTLAILSAFFTKLGSDSIPYIVLALAMLCILLSTVFLVSTVTQYFRLLETEVALKNEIAQIRARNSFLKDEEE